MSQNKITIPQILINKLVKDAVKKLFNYDWTPHMVIQNKLIKAESLDFIDYALPCFELGKRLEIDPQIIAKKIINQLELNLMDTELLGYKAEVIGGYINFQLSDEWLKRSIDVAKAWYENTGPIEGKPNNASYLVIGPDITKVNDLGITDTALSYLQQLYDSYSTKCYIDYLIADFSAGIIDELLHKLIETGQFPAQDPNLLRNAYMSVRRFMSGTNTDNGDVISVRKAYETFRNAWMNDRVRDLTAKGVSDFNLLSEYELKPQINDYIDNRASVSNTEGVVSGEQSAMAYFVSRKDNFPLRSPSGVLYELASIIYALDMAYKRSRTDNTSLVVIGSHRISLFISEMMHELVEGKKGQNRVTYFDPRVSRADIIEISARTFKLNDYYADIAKALESLKGDSMVDIRKRRLTLRLIDMPVMIERYLEDNKLPLVFDILNQSQEAIAGMVY